MPVLENPKHEMFAQGLASGLTIDKAYEQAGFKPSLANGCVLKNKPHILKRIKELLEEREKIHQEATAKAIEATSLSKEWVLARLKENAERALQIIPVMGPDGPSGEYKYEGSVANRALELIGKELQMFKDISKVENTGDILFRIERIIVRPTDQDA